MAENPSLTAWLRYWRVMRRYHRYTVVGLDKLVSDRAMLLVAYHGRPIAHDQCMLSVDAYERLGYMPHGVVHQAVSTHPRMQQVSDELGFVTEDGPAIERAVARAEHIAVQPGGTREGCRSVRHRYRVDWGQRTGFVRLALKHDLPVVPIASTGVDDAYVGFNDGYRWGKRLGAPAGLPVWIGAGLGGLWPFALPLPVRITTFIGDPIHLGANSRIDPSNPDALLGAQRRVAAAVQDLLDRARAR